MTDETARAGRSPTARRPTVNAWRRNLCAWRRSLNAWRWSIAAALALSFVALAPQLYLWAERGREWNGADFSFFFDEAAYESYVNALIAGRPRLNDPYTGRDHAPRAPQAHTPQAHAPQAHAPQADVSQADVPQAESLFSIQFIPAYALALPARLFNLSAATVFIILWPLAAFATTLALARLLRTVTADEATAATLALAVLSFCTFVQKGVRTLRGLETAYLPLPFLRRYLPALPFAFLFIFCLLVWRALTTDEPRTSATDRRRASLAHAVCAGLVFAVLVYSYFYLWTAALAWFFCLALLWLAASTGDERRRAARPLVTVAAIICLSLAPYAWLLARRAQTMDAAQALVHTRAPDLLRTSELVAALALLLLAFGVWRRRLAWRDRAVLLAVSLASTPFVVFNQQLFTGRSLQPIHYEQFVANYLSLVALALSIVLAARGQSDTTRRVGTEGAARVEAGRALFGGRLLACVALVSLGWASAEIFIATRRAARINVWADETRAVYLRLSEMAGVDGEFETAGKVGRRVVFCPDIAQADRLPNVAPQAVLWSPHMFVFSGVTGAEEKERLYQQLYYSNIDAGRFADFIGRPHPYRTAVFGWARVVNGLDAERAPLTPADLDAEVRAYAAYVSSFTRERAAQTPLSYVVTGAGQVDLKNIDRWYTRDAGERIGNHTIHRVELRP